MLDPSPILAGFQDCTKQHLIPKGDGGKLVCVT